MGCLYLGVVCETTRHLASGQAVAAKSTTRGKINVTNSSSKPAHFVLFDGAQIAENYIQDGPFVMGSEEQITDVKVAYEAGQFGSLADNP